MGMPDLKAFTTTYQFPYPLAGDSVQNTYTRIQELAERIEATYTTLGINLDSATALMQVGDAAGGDLAGSTYPNPTIASNAITTSKINDAAVTTVKIADSNVTTGKIANDAVTTAKLDVVDLKDGSTAVTQAQWMIRLRLLRLRMWMLILLVLCLMGRLVRASWLMVLLLMLR